jgi:hypothetical protein
MFAARVMVSSDVACPVPQRALLLQLSNSNRREMRFNSTRGGHSATFQEAISMGYGVSQICLICALRVLYYGLDVFSGVVSLAAHIYSTPMHKYIIYTAHK